MRSRHREKDCKSSCKARREGEEDLGGWNWAGEKEEPDRRKDTAKKKILKSIAKEWQSPCPVKNALQNLAGNARVG